MNIQFILVSICILAALAFMGKKVWQTFKKKGGCSCEATCRSANRCCCDGTCSQNPENRDE